MEEPRNSSTWQVLPRFVKASIFLFCLIELLGIGYSLTVNQGSVAVVHIFIFMAIDALILLSINVVLRHMSSSQVCLGGLLSSAMRMLLVSCLGGIALEGGTLFGAPLSSPLVFSDWNPIRLCIYAGCLFIIMIIWKLLGCSFSESLLSLKKKKMKETNLLDSKYSLVYILIIGIVVLSTYKSDLPLRVYIPFLILISLSIIYILYSKNRTKYQEYSFAIIATCAGLSIIIAFPVSNLSSWDDEIHYDRALEVSYIADVNRTASDRAMSQLLHLEPGFSLSASFDRVPVSWKKTWHMVDVSTFNNEFNKNYNKITTEISYGISNKFLNISSIAYLPSAVGLWFGRLLHLPYTLVFALGRVGNLLFYVIIGFYAIKISPSKKNLLMAILLLPTCVFMASSYSYDPWIICLSALGFAFYTREYVRGNQYDHRGITISLFILFIAFLPKAIYFPLLGIALNMLLTKRVKKSDGKVFLGIAFVFVILLFISFMLPLIKPAMGDVGDLRGGTDVNSMGQIRFILANPLQFTKTLITFIFTRYLPIGSIEGSMTNLAYYDSLNAVFPWALGFMSVYLCSISFIDSNQTSMSLISVKSRIWTCFIVFITIVLIASALYVSFTPVGSSSIAGVQPRYLLPLFYPIFLFILNSNIISYNKNISFITSVLSSGVLFISFWTLIISRIVW